MSIWQFKELKETLGDSTNLVTLEEGNTPADKFRTENVELIIKREDKNPTGSWKDRTTAYKLTKLISEGINEGVLSTSGNAAISLLTYIKNLNLRFKLHIVVGDNIKEEKLDIIKELITGTKNELHVSENPKLKSVEIAAGQKITNLKSATDEDSLKGYWALGFELMEFLNKQESNQQVGIFCPASSASGFVGMAQGIFMKLGSEYLMPRLFVCQSDKVHPFYNALKNTTDDSTTDSLADAIIDSSGLRTPQVLRILRESNGDALKISNDELNTVKEYTGNLGIHNLSFNSLLSIAGFLQVKNNYDFKKVICIASGR